MARHTEARGTNTWRVRYWESRKRNSPKRRTLIPLSFGWSPELITYLFNDVFNISDYTTSNDSITINWKVYTRNQIWPCVTEERHVKFHQNTRSLGRHLKQGPPDDEVDKLLRCKRLKPHIIKSTLP